jgi:hypothetical protein
MYHNVGAVEAQAVVQRIVDGAPLRAKCVRDVHRPVHSLAACFCLLLYLVM